MALDIMQSGGAKYNDRKISVPEFYTSREVSERLRVSPDTLRRLPIPYYMVGARRRYKPADVERYLGLRRFAPTVIDQARRQSLVRHINAIFEEELHG